MSNLLYLVHRLPFPPNKGDKVRSFHLLKHLSARHRVFLGTFVDDPDDEAYVDAVRDMCSDLHVVRLRPSLAKLRSLAALVTDQPLSVRYYRDAGLQDWVNRTLASENIDATVVFSSAMAQYLPTDADGQQPPMLTDFVDVDSLKWTQYSAAHRWPLSWLYEREGRLLHRFERAVAARSKKSFFVTEEETALFQKMAPESADAVVAMGNGVDTSYFSFDAKRESPFSQPGVVTQQIPLVFTGAMDYWPNMDAVIWFAQEVLPVLRRSWPQIRFYVVGRCPSSSVQALVSDVVVVTGTVPDVRPYLQHAALVVAPLRVARGLQNKILEAMAMGKPVVASRSCAHAIAAQGDELVCASGVSGFVREIDALLRAPARAASVGRAARWRVMQSYSWAAHLSGIDRYLGDEEPVQLKQL
jgi:sugar transferase (PEP-CTERM/EpsH1 system associated)